MHKHYFFVSLLTGFLWGIICGIFFSAWAFIGMIAIVIMLLIMIIFSPKYKKSVIIIIWVMSSLTGIWHAKNAMKEAVSVRIFNQKEIIFNGIVLQDAQKKTFNKQGIVEIRSCTIDGYEYGKKCPIARLLVSASLYNDNFRMRSGISGECTIKKIENFSDTFNYKMYRAKDYVYYECFVKSLQKWKLSYFYDKEYRILSHAREKMESILVKNIPQPQAALCAGLLFGGDDRLSKEWQDKFSAVGLTHIVAVSGYNVSVIAHFLIMAGIMIGLWRKQAIWVAIVGIIVFVLLIGAPTPAIRAAIMGITILLFAYTGRLSQALPALLLSAVIMLLYNPLLIRYDVGFQLSFLATLGIILLYPIASHFMMKNKTSLGIIEIIAVTVSAQLFVIPIIMYHFNIFSPVSLFANILILPIVPFAMLLAAITVTSGFLLAPLAVLVGWVTHGIVLYIFIIVDFFANMTYASVSVEMSIFFIIVYYSILAIVLMMLRMKISKKCHNQCNDKYQHEK